MAKYSADELGTAIASGDVALVEEHLASAAMPTTVVLGEYGRDPLELAAEHAEKNTESGRRILQALVGAASEEAQAEALIGCASEDADVSKLRTLLAAGVSPNVAKPDGARALLRAAGNGCVRNTYALLAAGADPTLAGPYGDAMEYASGTTRELVASKLAGKLLCPRQLLPEDAELETTLRAWLGALPALAKQRPGEVFYIFGLDGGRLRGNGERAFAETLETYRARDAESYASESDVQRLRMSPGDWSYTVESASVESASEAFTGALSLSSLEVREADDRTYAMVMTELLAENRATFARVLTLSDDFCFRSSGHTY